MSTTLYFAYTALISPHRMAEAAPQAEFKFIAHLPETRLVFPYSNGAWEGGLPSVRPEAGNTVWGAVFEVPNSVVAQLNEIEAGEGRVPTEEFKAVDREGRRHTVLTHVHNGAARDQATPSREYMRLIVEGGRHWKLPAGWVAGLEEYVEGPLF